MVISNVSILTVAALTASLLFVGSGSGQDDTDPRPAFRYGLQTLKQDVGRFA